MSEVSSIKITACNCGRNDSKMDNAFKALEQGVHSVIIGKGEKLNELIQGTAGTTIQL
jgi:acetylglutamate kinase